MANHKPVKIDQEQLKNAETLWGGFISASKLTVVASALVLILLAAFFV